ncbi:MAG: hypothetical protein J6B85_02860 [Lachnospiraceae bacterium]|nr:hypothetical protein [Lachnospiraceae bacterium]
MKKELIKNMDVKILSLVLAFLLWIIVMNVSDPVETKEFEDIPVKVINEEAIADAEKVYTIVSGSTVDITVKGPQSIVRSLSASNFTAIADLSKTSVVGAVLIDVKAPSKYEDKLTITTGKRNDEVLIISMEDKKTDDFRVNVRTVDEPSTNYYVMPGSEASPKMVSVTGAASKIDDIKEVVAEVSVQWKSASFVRSVELKAYNAYGYEVEGVEFDTEQVEVAVNIVPTKEIEVKVVPEGNAAYGYAVAEIKNDPEVITIAGEQSAIDEYSVFRPVFNISGQSGDSENHIMEGEIDLEADFGDELADKGIVFVDTNTKVSVRVTFQKEARQRLWLTAGDIEIRNVPENLEATIDLEGSYTKLIEVIGYSGAGSLTVADIKPYIDLSGGEYEPGITYQEEVYIDSPISSITLNGSCVVSVTFSEKIEMRENGSEG